MRPSVPAIVVTAAFGALAAPRAEAHVTPAIGDNNRYLKLTPLGDRLRLAYTVFYGEVPATAMRRALDVNHDGTIDDAETQAFGDRIAGELATAVAITVDGVAQPVTWAQVVVGMGTPSAAAGAFSIDLVAWLCLAAPRGHHTVVLRDSFRLDRPGETEVKVEDSPGLTIDASRIGGAEDEAHDYKLVGPSGALETEGLEVRFTAGDKAIVAADRVCPGTRRARAIPIGWTVAVAAVIAFVLAGLASLALRMRRRRASRA
jgi:hypothetical protein